MPQLRLLPPFDGDTQLDKHGVPTEDQLQRMVGGHLPLMIGDRLPGGLRLSQRNDAGLVKAPFQPPATRWCSARDEQALTPPWAGLQAGAGVA